MVKERFEIFSMDQYADDIFGMTILLVSNKMHLHQPHPPYTMRFSPHKMLYLQFFVSYNICIIYLHVSQPCLKITIVTDYFCNSKNPIQIIRKMFLIPSLYILKKNHLVNKYWEANMLQEK